MATPIRIKRSAVSGKRPALDQLKLGELALNTYDGYLFTERDTGGVGIGTTITLLTPWSENFGAGSIYYQDNVGIGTDNTYGIKLSVDGSLKVTGVSTLGVTTATNLTVQQLNVSGVSTFGTGTIIIDGDNNNIQIGTGVTITSNSISLDGGLTVASLEVSGTSGLSTFTSDLDINASIDVDGHSELDTVNVSAASTFGGLVDINAGARANTFKVEDLTDNRVVIAGTGGELEDDANLTFDGSTLSVDVDLDVDGRTELDITNISETLNVVGVSTFASNVDLNADLDVDGHTELDNVNVSTALTASNLVANLSVSLGYDGNTKLETTAIGVSISNGSNTTATITGPSNLVLDPAVVGDNTGVVRIKGDLFVDGTQTQINSTTIEFADFIVGVATTATTDLLTDGAGIGIGSDKFFTFDHNNTAFKSTENLNLETGHTYKINGVNVLSNNTLGSNVVNSSLTNLGTLTELDVNGHTELDNLNVSGVSTFVSDLDINASVDIDGHTELDNLNVAGVSTFVSNVNLNADLDVDGRTELDIINISETLNVTGVSTFVSNVNLNADLDVDGRTELDITNISETLNVVGIATFVNNIDANGDLDVDGRTELDITNISETLNVVGIATFGSDLDINASVDIDGHTELDNLNVSGVSTFVSNVNLSANLDVDGQTDLDILNVAETATFSSNIDANGNLDVDGQTDLDVLNVAELATFTGNIDANGNLDVDGQTDLDVLNVAELATFTNNITANGNIVGDDATNISGINSVTASSFFGSGIGLTSLNADDLSSGTIPDARFPSILPALDGSALTGITATAVGAIGGLTVKDEGTTVGTAGSISSFNFVGSNVSVIANEGAAGVATVTIDTITNNSTVLIDGSSAISIDNVGGGSTSFTLNQSNDKVVNIGIVTSQVTGIVTSQLNLGAPLNNFLQTPSSSNFASVVSDNTGTGSLVFAESPSLKDVSIKDGVGDVYSIGGFSASYSTTSQVDIHSILLASTYRSVEYTIQATEGTNYHTTKIIALHDGTTVSKSEYGTIHNNNIVAVFDIDITSGEIRLLATAESANETTYKISFVAIRV